MFATFAIRVEILEKRELGILVRAGNVLPKTLEIPYSVLWERPDELALGPMVVEVMANWADAAGIPNDAFPILDH